VVALKIIFFLKKMNVIKYKAFAKESEDSHHECSREKNKAQRKEAKRLFFKRIKLFFRKELENIETTYDRLKCGTVFVYFTDKIQFYSTFKLEEILNKEDLTKTEATATINAELSNCNNQLVPWIKHINN
jgi:hypothetical protein